MTNTETQIDNKHKQTENTETQTKKNKNQSKINIVLVLTSNIGRATNRKIESGTNAQVKFTSNKHFIGNRFVLKERKTEKEYEFFCQCVKKEDIIYFKQLLIMFNCLTEEQVFCPI
jgi:hypothetical protein